VRSRPGALGRIPVTLRKDFGKIPGGKQAIPLPLLAFGLTTFRLPEDFGKIPGGERTMGGYGSGRPSGARSRGLVESCLVLDINELLRKRLLRPGALNCGPMTFAGPRYVADGTFWYDLLEDMELDVRVQHPEDPSASSNTIRLERSLSSLGAVRFWFRCPLSARRVAKLYLPPGSGVFGSRPAHGLAYRSQRISRLERAYEGRAASANASGERPTSGSAFPNAPLACTGAPISVSWPRPAGRRRPSSPTCQRNSHDDHLRAHAEVLRPPPGSLSRERP